MSKRTSDGRSKNSRPEIAEPTPPLLSEKLIAQLQGAVSAAQCKRNPVPLDASEGSLGLVTMNPEAPTQS